MANNMTTDKEKELEEIINMSILFRAKDCPVERRRKEHQRKALKEKIILFISSL